MRDRLNLAFPSILLVSVAVVQIFRAHTHDQSPWKGGGFGMFSTSDSPEARFVRCVVVGPDGEHRVYLPSRLAGEVGLARTVPTGENVLDLGRELAALQWVREDYSAAEPALPSPGDASIPGEAPAVEKSARVDPSLLTWRVLEPGEPKPPKELLLDLQSVRVEIWKMQLDASGTHMNAVLIRSETTTP